MTLGSFLRGSFRAGARPSPEANEAKLKKMIERAAAIVAAYGNVLSDDQKGDLIQDDKRLPHSKEQIKAAVRVLLRVTKEPRMRGSQNIALSSYQPLTANQKQALRQWKAAKGRVGPMGDSDLKAMARAVTESGEAVQNLQRIVASEMDAPLQEFDREANRFQ